MKGVKMRSVREKNCLKHDILRLIINLHILGSDLKFVAIPHQSIVRRFINFHTMMYLLHFKCLCLSWQKEPILGIYKIRLIQLRPHFYIVAPEFKHHFDDTMFFNSYLMNES